MIKGLPEDEAEEAREYIDELIKRNIQAYGYLQLYSRYETHKLIAGFELALYKDLADKYPEYLKMFIR